MNAMWVLKFFRRFQVDIKWLFHLIFASLYPTTIIAYNIDYHTWVPPGSNIPDSMCHVMEWEDHLGCEHDPKVIRKLTTH